MMKIAIIKYNAGNIMSVDFALQRLGIESEVTDDYEKITKADKVIFPGVGEASSTIAYLKEKKLDEVIKNLKQPVLGICLGLQLLCSHSEEGNVNCLNVFSEKVKLFKPILKVPHMGWNTITNLSTKLFSSEIEGSYVYFVHSYYAELGPDTIATSDYTLPFSASLHKKNFFATQFHPEKSSEVGAKLLKNFIDM